MGSELPAADRIVTLNALAVDYCTHVPAQQGGKKN